MQQEQCNALNAAINFIKPPVLCIMGSVKQVVAQHALQCYPAMGCQYSQAISHLASLTYWPISHLASLTYKHHRIKFRANLTQLNSWTRKEKFQSVALRQYFLDLQALQNQIQSQPNLGLDKRNLSQWYTELLSHIFYYWLDLPQRLLTVSRWRQAI